MGYFNLTSSFPYKAPLLRSQLDALTENDAYLKDHNWQDATRMLFHQASVPTGWTLATYLNDRWLRVVSGLGGGNGGSHLASSPIPFAHSHTIDTVANHTHAVTEHWHTLAILNTVNRVFGIGSSIISGAGDQDLQWFNDGGGGTNQTIIGKLEELASSEVSSPAGGHTHTFASAGSNFQISYADVIVGEKDTSSGYTDLTNFFQVDQKIDWEVFTATLNSLFKNDEYTKDRIPFGARTVVFGATAPLGWQKISVSSNGFGLRTNSTGGGYSAGNTIPGATMMFNHYHAMGPVANHDHTTPNHRHNFDESSVSNYNNLGGYMGNAGGALVPLNSAGGTHTIYRGRTANDGGGANMGAAGYHWHSETVIPLQNVQFKYLDVIQIEKLSSGAPYAYDTHPQTIAFKKLVSKQRLQGLAKNDEYLLFHVRQAGMKTFFYMSTPPITWTQIVSHDDKFLRFNNAGGGTYGGVKGLSTLLEVEHTHTFDTVPHYHSIPSHIHNLDSRSATAGTQFLAGGVAPWYAAIGEGGVPPNKGYVGEILSGLYPPFSWPVRPLTDAHESPMNSDNNAHTHTADSFGTDVELAYVDVILCQKD